MDRNSNSNAFNTVSANEGGNSLCDIITLLDLLLKVFFLFFFHYHILRNSLFKWRYNSRNINFTILKCIISLVVHSCTTIIFI